MFDPTLTESQEALIETARRFAAEKIVPVAGKYDESGEFPKDIFHEAWELGLLTRVFNQDVYNLPRVQQGLESGAIDEVVFARYQETKIRMFQRELERWVGC